MPRAALAAQAAPARAVSGGPRAVPCPFEAVDHDVQRARVICVVDRDAALGANVVAMKRLDLARNFIGDEGAAALGKALKVNEGAEKHRRPLEVGDEGGGGI